MRHYNLIKARQRGLGVLGDSPGSQPGSDSRLLAAFWSHLDPLRQPRSKPFAGVAGGRAPSAGRCWYRPAAGGRGRLAALRNGQRWGLHVVFQPYWGSAGTDSTRCFEKSGNRCYGGGASDLFNISGTLSKTRNPGLWGAFQSLQAPSAAFPCLTRRFSPDKRKDQVRPRLRLRTPGPPPLRPCTPALRPAPTRASADCWVPDPASERLPTRSSAVWSLVPVPTPGGRSGLCRGFPRARPWQARRTEAEGPLSSRTWRDPAYGSR